MGFYNMFLKVRIGVSEFLMNEHFLLSFSNILTHCQQSERARNTAVCYSVTDQHQS